MNLFTSIDCSHVRRLPVKKGELLLSLENSVAKLQMELSELQLSLRENTLREAYWGHFRGIKKEGLKCPSRPVEKDILGVLSGR